MSPAQVLLLGIIALFYGAAVVLGDRSLEGRGRLRGAFRFGAVVLPIVAFGLTMQQFTQGHAVLGLKLPPDYERLIDYTKLTLAMTAAMAVFYERHRASVRRPIAPRWKKFVGIALALAAISTYFNGFPLANKPFTWAPYYHRWDQFHYYMGAKYFREMGYDGLYKCALIAQDAAGEHHAAAGGFRHALREGDIFFCLAPPTKFIISKKKRQCLLIKTMIVPIYGATGCEWHILVNEISRALEQQSMMRGTFACLIFEL